MICSVETGSGERAEGFDVLSSKTDMIGIPSAIRITEIQSSYYGMMQLGYTSQSKAK